MHFVIIFLKLKHDKEVKHLFFLPIALSANAYITLTRTKRDLFILLPSFNLSIVASVYFCLSLPIRSTKLIFDNFELFVLNSIVTVL